MNVWGLLLKCAGWKVKITVPYRNKAVICVAPHTSNWDFIVGLLAYRSIGRKAEFLMKKFWFFFPLKYILKSLGGIPVNQNASRSLTSILIEDFKKYDQLNLAVTPEGSRSAVQKWRTGFLTIAHNAGVPIQLGIIDFKNKEVLIQQEFKASGNNEKDLLEIQEFYSRYKFAAKYPDKFLV